MTSTEKPAVDQTVAWKTSSGTSVHIEPKAEEDQNDVFNDGPRAVLVNLLTRKRYLLPGMHSFLVVMALCWVCASILIPIHQICVLILSFLSVPINFLLGLWSSDTTVISNSFVMYVFYAVVICHVCLLCSCHGFHLFFLILIGWDIYHADPKGHAAEVEACGNGVRVGTLGLLLNSVVLGLALSSLNCCVV